jgi:hypothetical protein
MVRQRIRDFPVKGRAVLEGIGANVSFWPIKGRQMDRYPLRMSNVSAPCMVVRDTGCIADAFIQFEIDDPRA